MLQKDFLNMGKQRSTAYSTPSVNVFEFSSEGLICASGPDIPDAGYDTDNDLGEI